MAIDSLKIVGIYNSIFGLYKAGVLPVQDVDLPKWIELPIYKHSN
jgi:hypothetical protein